MPPNATNADPVTRPALPQLAHARPAAGLRIVQLITEMAPAGAEKVVHDLAIGLSAKGHQVHVATLLDAPGAPATLTDDLARHGVSITRLRMRSKGDLPRLSALASLLRRSSPHVLHTHLWHADLAAKALLPAVWRRRPMLLSTIHIPDRRPVHWRFAIDRLTQLWVDQIAFVSPSVMHFYRRRVGLAAHKCVVVPNGIDLAAYQALPDRLHARAQWISTSAEPVIGTIARLDPQKGLPALLHAFSILARRWKRAALLIAGTGPERQALEDLAVKLGVADRLHMLGFQQDVRPVLAALDVFVLPSRWEGFGLATLEAMAAGLPVVVTDVPGSRDLVQHEQTGLVVPPNDSDALARAIARCLSHTDLRVQLGQRARIAAGAFTVQKMVDRYEQLYLALTPRLPRP
ncbi:MAG TPA: glycosyltransferase [Phycisphaerae bacterium]|nr:glycosyltransferase [Phycisphaerae bacterium]